MKIVKETRKDGSLRVQMKFERSSRTQAHMAEATDINRIMGRYIKTSGDRLLKRLPDPHGVFADLADLGDYQENMNRVLQARDTFMMLPASFRAELANDPGNLEPWLRDPENRDRAVKMGMMKPVQKAEAKIVTSNDAKNGDAKLPDDPKP